MTRQSFDVDGPDAVTQERDPVDLEFYGQPGGRMARIRRVRHSWEEFGDNDCGGGMRLSLLLTPSDPPHPEQTFEFQQLCEDGRWRIVSDHEDLELVKRAADRWVREGGEITEFYVD